MAGLTFDLLSLNVFDFFTMNNQDFNAIQQYLSALTESFLDSLPKIAGAVLLIIIGWLVATLVRFLLNKLLSSINRLLFRHTKWKKLQQLEIEGTLLKLIPDVVYWFLILFFIIGAADVLGLEVFNQWLNKLIAFLPLLFLAFIIVLTGIGLGQVFSRLWIKRGPLVNVPYGSIIGSGVQVTIVLISIVIALNTLGIELGFLTTLFAVLLAGFLLATALAFGLGSRNMVSNIIAGHFAGKIYQVGHQVEIDGIKGTILKIESGFIVIETQEGEVSVPASTFLEKKSTKIT